MSVVDLGIGSSGGTDKPFAISSILLHVWIFLALQIQSGLGFRV
jgi:hypothetical protein